MTKEERKEHAFEISNEYVAKISPDDTEIMREIENLPIQDVITIHSNAKYALKENMFFGISEKALEAGEEPAVRFDDAIKRLRRIVVERLKTAERLWTIKDGITRSPFIDYDDDMWIFTEREYADECLDFYMQQYRTSFEVAEITKDETVRFFGISSYMKGAKGFAVDMFAYANVWLSCEEIIPRPNFDGTPFINRPVMNPDLFRTVAKLRQEMLYRANYDGKAERLRKFEDEMIKEFNEAKFLVPVKGLSEAINPNGLKSKEGIVEKGTKFSIPSLSIGDGEQTRSALPIFTDWEEFNKTFSQDEWGGWILTLEDVAAFPKDGNDGTILDAGSLAFESSEKMIWQMLEIYRNEFENGGKKEAEKPTSNDENENDEEKKARAVLKGIEDGDGYYAPFCYEGEEDETQPDDDEVHYSEEALLPKDSDGTTVPHHVDSGKTMRFIKIKNSSTGDEYLPMFTSVERLRKIYPRKIARVALVGKKYVENFALEGKGILIDCGTPILNDFISKCGFELAEPTKNT